MTEGQSVGELRQGHRDLLMLFQASPQFKDAVVSRRFLVAGMILIQDDQLRGKLLKASQKPLSRPRNEMTVNQILSELEIDGFLQQVPSPYQQLWKLSPTAPEIPCSEEDRTRAEEVMQILMRQVQFRVNYLATE